MLSLVKYLIAANGLKAWLKNNNLHYCGDKPAFIWNASGGFCPANEWYQNGNRHRANGKYAVIEYRQPLLSAYHINSIKLPNNNELLKGLFGDNLTNRID